jgi:surfeit locus 1 family protein
MTDGSSPASPRRFRPTLWPTVFALLALATLLALGTWQLQRLAWKTALINEIIARQAMAPIPLPTTIEDPAALRFRKVSVHGTFDHSREVHLFAHTKRGNLGYQVITPLKQDDGTWVLINRGWVPDERKDPASRAEGQVTGPVAITGTARPTWHRHMFLPDNDTATNHWFFGDIPAMAAHLGLSVAPVFVEADATANPGGLPIGGQTPTADIANNHLQYALTWYMLAVALAGVYFVYHWRRDEPGSA